MRSAAAAASVKPRACSSGFSGVIHSPVGCSAIRRIRSASARLPSSSRAASRRAAVLSGLTQNGAVSLGCWVIPAPPPLPSSPPPGDEQAAISRTAPSSAADARVPANVPAAALPYIRAPLVRCWRVTILAYGRPAHAAPAAGPGRLRGRSR
ncbi:hypothetical protein SFUMM280S_00315 [Streptomyces fumanus]